MKNVVFRALKPGFPIWHFVSQEEIPLGWLRTAEIDATALMEEHHATKKEAVILLNHDWTIRQSKQPA